MRTHVIILSSIKAILFIIIIVVFGGIFKFDDVLYNVEGKLVLFDVFDSLKNVLSYCLYFLLYGIAIAIGFGIASIFILDPNFNSSFMFTFIDSFFKNFIGQWFSFPSKEAPFFHEISGLIAEETAIFLNNIYLFTFQIFFVIAIFFFIRSIFETDPKYSLAVIGGLVMMIVLPLMVFGLKDMLELFTIKVDFLEELENPVSTRLTKIPLDNILLFLVSPAALIAIVCYIYLEISFQLNYIDTVMRPSLERSDRLETQLDIIRRESMLITTNIDKIKEEAKKRKEELGIEEARVSKFFSKASQQFSYVKEMIEKRKLEEEEKKLVSAASKTRRLGRYMERLFREDRESEDTLTAKSSSPRAKNLITSTIINFSFRLVLLITISFIIIHPKWFFINVFNLPPAITESVEMYSPEVILILLIPFMLIFPVIAYTISYIKHRNLIIRLKQEGRIKEILASVGDYVKKEAPMEEEKEAQTEGEQIASETA
ncbi:MAG: hypothetical protein EU539_12160 [Promethearchaeota archaeon]|nr:MAG: hypothetical protein EU539_12160 [Candidatus Lokiarchaeota archaeon]